MNTILIISNYINTIKRHIYITSSTPSSSTINFYLSSLQSVHGTIIQLKFTNFYQIILCDPFPTKRPTPTKQNKYISILCIFARFLNKSDPPIVRFLPFTNPILNLVRSNNRGGWRGCWQTKGRVSRVGGGEEGREAGAGWSIAGESQQLNQMIEKKQSNWISMQSSLGFNCELFNSNSRFLSRQKEEEASEGFNIYAGDCEENFQPTHPFSIDNTINFSDLQQRLLLKQPLPLPTYPTYFRPLQQHEPEWAPTDQLGKRGLKQLASLLLRSFFKKRFSSLREVVQEIEGQLLNPSDSIITNIKEKPTTREQKNIKRRIYDALNVMLSAGILQREVFGTDGAQTKSYGVVSRRSDFVERVGLVRERLEAKRELLRTLQSKRKALEEWIDRKKGEGGPQKKGGRQGEDKKEGLQVEKEGKDDNQESCLQTQRLQFPLVILVCGGQGGVWIQVEEESVLMGYKKGEVYSQTDLLQVVAGGRAFQQNQIKKQQKFLDEITYI